jgi:hypothetical protein
MDLGFIGFQSSHGFTTEGENLTNRRIVRYFG